MLREIANGGPLPDFHAIYYYSVFGAEASMVTVGSLFLACYLLSYHYDKDKKKWHQILSSPDMFPHRLNYNIRLSFPFDFDALFLISGLLLLIRMINIDYTLPSPPYPTGTSDRPCHTQGPPWHAGLLDTIKTIPSDRQTSLLTLAPPTTQSRGPTGLRNDGDSFVQSGWAITSWCSSLVPCFVARPDTASQLLFHWLHGGSSCEAWKSVMAFTTLQVCLQPICEHRITMFILLEVGQPLVCGISLYWKHDRSRYPDYIYSQPL